MNNFCCHCCVEFCVTLARHQNICYTNDSIFLQNSGNGAYHAVTDTAVDRVVVHDIASDDDSNDASSGHYTQ